MVKGNVLPSRLILSKNQREPVEEVAGTAEKRSRILQYLFRT